MFPIYLFELMYQQIETERQVMLSQENVQERQVMLSQENVQENIIPE